MRQDGIRSQSRNERRATRVTLKCVFVLMSDAEDYPFACIFGAASG